MPIDAETAKVSSGMSSAQGLLVPGDSQYSSMLSSLDTYISDRDTGMGTSQLFEHQHDVFHSIRKFLGDVCLNQTVAPRGYIKLPPGYGKTAILATLVDVLKGYEAASPDGKQPKALVLEPQLDLIAQTLGTEDADNLRGFARFAPDLHVTEYHGTKKDLDGEVVVMTNYSFVNALKDRRLPPRMFNLIIADEAHTALGALTKTSLLRYSKGKLAIGLTATPDYGDEKKVSDIFPYPIHRMEMREGVEEGFLSPVQCLAIDTQERIEIINPFSTDFSDAELEKLITHEWRNAKGVEFAKALIEQGKQGIIACVPGQNVEHAHRMASLLRNETITDPKTGATRPIVAVALSGEMPSATRQQLYKDYERGEIDCFTFVDLLGLGWDSQAAKFLINLRPTTSPVLAEQRLGRILRPTDNNEVAVVVEFIDKSERLQHTFYQIFGEQEINPRKVYGRGNSKGPGIPEQSVIFENLPENIRERLKQLDYRVIGELIIQRMPEAPEGYVALSKFSRSVRSSEPFIRRLIEERGINTETFLNHGRVTDNLSPDAQIALLSLPELQIEQAPEGYKSIAQLARDWKTSAETLMSLVESSGAEIEVHKYGSRPHPAPGLSAEAQALLSSQPDFYLPVPEESVSVPTLARQLGISKALIEELIETHNIPTDVYRSHTHIVPCLTPEARTQLLELEELKDKIAIQPPPEGYINLRTFAKSLGLGKDWLHSIAETHSIKLEQHRYGGKAGLGLSQEAQEQLLQVLETIGVAEPAPEDYMALKPFSELLGVDYKKVKKIAKEAGIQFSKHKFSGGNVALSVSPEVREQLASMEELKPATPAPEGYIRASELAAKLNRTSQTLLVMADKNGIPYPRHRFGVRTVSRSFSPKAQEQLIELDRNFVRRNRSKE